MKCLLILVDNKMKKVEWNRQTQKKFNSNDVLNKSSFIEQQRRKMQNSKIVGHDLIFN